MSTELQSSTIVITGVTRGLGRAMVDEFVRLGHRVCGCGRTGTAIKELRRIYPRQDFQVLNVASDTEVKQWAERILRKCGPPDFILNNAAVINAKASLWEVDGGEFSDEIDINLKGVVNVVRHFLPPMIGDRKGVIVNFTSRWGTRFEKEMAPYCATKWAVVALTLVLAQELKTQGIAVVGLNPGIVRTEMFQKYMGSKIAPDTSKYPTAVEWAKKAVPYILRLHMKDTGKLRSVFGPSKVALNRPKGTTHKECVLREESLSKTDS